MLIAMISYGVWLSYLGSGCSLALFLYKVSTHVLQLIAGQLRLANNYKRE